MNCAIIILALVYGVLSGPIEDEAVQEFTASNRRFTAAVYKEFIKTKSGNIVVSPLCAQTVLSLTNEGARGETTAEFVTGLSLPQSSEKTQRAFKTFLPRLRRSEDDLKLLSANKIYVGDDVKLEDNFKSIATNVYDSAVENVDFAQSVQAARSINSWVEDNTNHKITNLIDPKIIDDSTKIVLVNALYFSGKWVSRFEENETKKKRFFKTKDDPINVDTMHQVEYLKYYENPTLNAKFLELPYKGADISMVVVLPNEIDGLASLEQNIEQVLEAQPFSKEKVDVELPKFTIETQVDFIPILQSLGIRRIFDGRADLTGLSSTHKNLSISDVIQKAFIDVREAGTEAAAATAGVIQERSGHSITFPPVDFHVDRPFFYFIKVNDAVVVAGRYNPV